MLGLDGCRGVKKGGNVECSHLGAGYAKASSCFSAMEQVCEEQQVDTEIICPKSSPSLWFLFYEIGLLWLFCESPFSFLIA